MNNICLARIWSETEANTRCKSQVCSESKHFCTCHYKQFLINSNHAQLDSNNKNIGLFYGQIDQDVPYRFNDILVIEWRCNKIRKKIIEDISNGLIKNYQSVALRKKNKYSSIFNENRQIKRKILKYLRVDNIEIKSLQYRSNNNLIISISQIKWIGDKIKKNIIEDISNGLIKYYLSEINKYSSIFNKNGKIKKRLLQNLGVNNIEIKGINSQGTNTQTSLDTQKSSDTQTSLDTQKSSDTQTSPNTQSFNSNKKDINNNMNNDIDFIDTDLIEEYDDIKEKFKIRIDNNNKVFISYDNGATFDDEYGIYYYSQYHGENIIENKVNGGIRFYKEVYKYDTKDEAYNLLHKEKL